ncbi:peptidoglycan-binding domain-containing protein [Streptomyces gardneri]|uniref:peptidoglycan-binding domain-containing protein n=1 Tax=Streptomyces gardneri TaxID=66892 RepID=UPI00368E5990
MRHVRGPCQENHSRRSAVTATAPTRVDGYYGPLTAWVVRLTQEFTRIPVDGVYGPQTRAAMSWVVNDSSRTLCVKF